MAYGPTTPPEGWCAAYQATEVLNFDDWGSIPLDNFHREWYVVGNMWMDANQVENFLSGSQVKRSFW